MLEYWRCSNIWKSWLTTCLLTFSNFDILVSWKTRIDLTPVTKQTLLQDDHALGHVQSGAISDPTLWQLLQLGAQEFLVPIPSPLQQPDHWGCILWILLVFHLQGWLVKPTKNGLSATFSKSTFVTRMPQNPQNSPAIPQQCGNDAS